MTPRICFDNAATTPMDRHAFEAMRPHLEAAWGNMTRNLLRKGYVFTV